MKESTETGLGALEDLAHARRGKRNVVRRMYDWTIHWAETPYGGWALFVLAFAEASFFPIPPDVLLIALALGAPKKSLRFSAVCTTGSVLGACLGYAIGMFFFEVIGRPILDFYSLWGSYGAISEGFRNNGFFYVFAAALTPIPFKVFTIAAGACQVSLGVVIAAAVLGRGLRFFVLGALFRLFGPPIKRFIDRYFNLLTVLFLIVGVLGFVCVKWLWGGEETAPQPAEPPPGTEQPTGGEGGGEPR